MLFVRVQGLIRVLRDRMTRKSCLGLLVCVLGLSTVMVWESNAGFDSGVIESNTGRANLQFAADDQQGTKAETEKPPGDLPPPKKKNRSPGALPPASSPKVDAPAK
jgi:hypothetical protein